MRSCATSHSPCSWTYSGYSSAGSQRAGRVSQAKETWPSVGETQDTISGRLRSR